MEYYLRRIREVAKDGNGMPGTVFQLKAIKNDAEVLVTEDTDYEDIVGVEETVEIDADGETKTFYSASITTGEEQIIRRLRDGTYILGFLLMSFSGACLLIISKGRRKAV